MARPRKPKTVEEYQGRYRCTVTEKNVIFENARQSGLQLNEYIRRRLIGHSPIYSAEAMHVVAELQKMNTLLWGMKTSSAEERILKYDLMKEIKSLVLKAAKMIGKGAVEEDDYNDQERDADARSK